MGDKSELPNLQPGVYEHFKGGRYEVEAVAVNEADGEGDEWIVYYHKLGESGLRIKPPLWRRFEDFVEPKLIDGKTVERYRKIDDLG